MKPQKCSECTRFIPEKRINQYKNRTIYTCSKICSGVREYWEWQLKIFMRLFHNSTLRKYDNMSKNKVIENG